MIRLISLFLAGAFFLTGTVLAVDVKQTDVFTATTRIDKRDWSAEPLALFFPGAVLPGEDELWVTAFVGDIWHINTVTGRKILLGFKESQGNIKDGMHIQKFLIGSDIGGQLPFVEIPYVKPVY